MVKSAASAQEGTNKSNIYVTFYDFVGVFGAFKEYLMSKVNKAKSVFDDGCLFVDGKLSVGRAINMRDGNKSTVLCAQERCRWAP